MKNKKEYILFPADIGTHWIGGLYYFKNIIYSLLQSKKIRSKYKILIVTTEDCKDVFSVFENDCDIYVHSLNNKVGIQLEYLMIFSKYKVAYIYNAGRLLKLLRAGKKCVYWIADFQHVHYPKFFTNEVRYKRDKSYGKIAKRKLPLVLSSNDALKDYEEYFHGDRNQVNVVHFVSYIEKELRSLTPAFEKTVLEKYGLSKYQYVYVPNQFWEHKNQLTVLKAIRKLPSEVLAKYKFVFSGNLNSYKDNKYVNSIKNAIEKPPLDACCFLLGFLDRAEQLSIMKNCRFIIQPSLFEGWSTVVEDTKVLNKNIILSDISVHREQNYNKSIFFNPKDPKELSGKIIGCLNREDYEEDINIGIQRMKEDAKTYSRQLEKVFKD